MIRTPCMGINSLWTWPRLNSCRDTPFFGPGLIIWAHALSEKCSEFGEHKIWGAVAITVFKSAISHVRWCSRCSSLCLLPRWGCHLQSSGPFRVQPPSYDAPMWWTGNAHPAASCAAELPQARSLCSSLPPVSDGPHQLRACDSGWRRWRAARQGAAPCRHGQAVKYANIYCGIHPLVGLQISVGWKLQIPGADLWGGSRLTCCSPHRRSPASPRPSCSLPREFIAVVIPVSSGFSTIILIKWGFL